MKLSIVILVAFACPLLQSEGGCAWVSHWEIYGTEEVKPNCIQRAIHGPTEALYWCKGDEKYDKIWDNWAQPE